MFPPTLLDGFTCYSKHRPLGNKTNRRKKRRGVKSPGEAKAEDFSSHDVIRDVKN